MADVNDPRSALWLAVAQLCQREEQASGTCFAPAFVDALAHVVGAQAETTGADLECFANHAKRAKITTDDVRLCLRRNKDLEL
ncbi:MHF histone-fold complex component [Coemansia sp. RSA 552]|nr:MHF histone-fold complex component [Coemansia sp. RSA 552]